MTPKNLPTGENNYKSDWWTIEKLSQLVSFEQNRFLNFYKQPQFKKWWKFSLSTTILFIIALSGFVYSYQNTAFIRSLLPKTNSVIIAIAEKTEIVPAFFAKIGANINSRYNLSSIFSSLEEDK